MEKYINTASDLITGRAIPAATVSVYRAGTGTLATLYEDDGLTTKGNPVTADANAEYSFAAVNGRYDIVVSKTGYQSHTMTNVELYDKSQASDYGMIASSTDNTGALQDAIDAIQTRVGAGNSNGDVIEIPPGTHNFLGTINITNSFIRLVGAGTQSTFLNFTNGAADCIVVDGASSPGGQLREVWIEDLAIASVGKSAGATVKLLNAYRSGLSKGYIEQGITLIDVGPNTNGIALDRLHLVASGTGILHGIYWHCPGTGAARSDVLDIHQVVIEGNWSDATGLLWEGFCNTLCIKGMRILHCNYGLRTTNPAASSSYYPSFMNAVGLEAEGFKTRAVSLEAGVGFKFSGCDINNLTGSSGQGNADDYAFAILPDTGHSATRSIQLCNSRIGLCRSAGIYVNATDVQISNVVCVSTSMASTGGAPAVKIDTLARDVQISNLRGEEYGGAAKASYAIQIENGAQAIAIANADGTYCQTGAVNNLSSAGAVSVLGTIEPGSTGSNFVSYGNTEVRLQKSVSGSSYTLMTYNASSSNNSIARYEWATGAGNSYVLADLNNGAATPSFAVSAGSAVVSATYTFPKHVFMIGANTAFAIGQALGNYANDAAAAAGNIPLYGFYRNGGVVQQRIA